jgi:hypothetical protein
VTFTEALAILGIHAGTDARSARRAYLRLVKTHKPERDPDGFQRVRTAWELVEPRLFEGEPDEERHVAPPTPMKVVVWEKGGRFSPVRPVPEADAAPPAPPDPPPPDGPAPWEPPPSPDFSAFVLRPTPAPADTRRELPDPAPWEPPPPPDARSWTVEPLPDPDPPGPPVELRPAEPFVPRPNPAQLVIQALEAAPIDADLALDALRRGLEAAQEGHRPDPDVKTAVDTVLALHRAGAPGQARDAWSLVRRWIDATGAGTRMTGNTAAWLALCRELSDLPLRFPPAVRRRLAEAIYDQDLAAAENDLLELYRSQPHVAIDAAELLESHAPNLHKLYGPSLRDPAGNQAPPPGPAPEAEAPKGGIGVSMFVYLAILVASIALRVCIADGPSSTPNYYLPPPVPLELAPWEPIPMPSLEVLPPDRDHLDLTVRVLCLVDDDPTICRAATDALAALGRNDCEAARAAMAPIARRIAPDGPTESLDTAGMLRQIMQRVDTRCPLEEPPVEP